MTCTLLRAGSGIGCYVYDSEELYVRGTRPAVSLLNFALVEKVVSK